MLDTRGLGYVYDTVTAPGAVAAVGPELLPREVGREVSAPSPAQPPQLIGATVGVPIVADRSADVALSAPAVAPRATFADEGPAEPREWLLSLEGITGTMAAPVYSVYLNVPTGAAPADHPELLAGMITTFGLPEASRPGGDHDGMGLSFVFDVTRVHDSLLAAGNWDPATLSVTFVPLAPPAPDDPAFAERLAAAPPVQSDVRAARIAVLVA